MDPSLRGALWFVRFLALVLVGTTIVLVGLQAAENLAHQQPVAVFPCLIRSLPLVAGLLMLFKSRALAQWLADWLEQ